jgi:hypothetical protein
MQKPTRLGFGEGCHFWGSEQHSPRDSAGVLAMACVSAGDRRNLGKPHRVFGCDDRPDAREGQAGLVETLDRIRLGLPFPLQARRFKTTPTVKISRRFLL